MGRRGWQSPSRGNQGQGWGRATPPQPWGQGVAWVHPGLFVSTAWHVLCPLRSESGAARCGRPGKSMAGTGCLSFGPWVGGAPRSPGCRQGEQGHWLASEEEALMQGGGPTLGPGVPVTPGALEAPSLGCLWGGGVTWRSFRNEAVIWV